MLLLVSPLRPAPIVTRYGANGKREDIRAFFVGPLSDAVTHAGDLAMLRRLAGSPVPAEASSTLTFHDGHQTG